MFYDWFGPKASFSPEGRLRGLKAQQYGPQLVLLAM